MTTESKKPAPRRRAAAEPKAAPKPEGVVNLNLTEEIKAFIEKHSPPEGEGEPLFGCMMLSDGKELAFASYGPPEVVKGILQSAYAMTHEQDLRQQLEELEASRKQGMN